MKTILQLFADGTLMENVIALVVTVGIIVLLVSSKPIPDLLGQSFLLILGFYFGRRTMTGS